MCLTEQNKCLSGLRSMFEQALEGREAPFSNRPEGDLPVFLAGLKELVLEAAGLSGWAVVNADNRQAESSLPEGRVKVVYFSAEADNIIVRRHLGVGGAAVFIRDEQVLAATGGKARPIAAANQFPGRHSERIVTDALATAAGFWALRIKPGEIWR